MKNAPPLFHLKYFCLFCFFITPFFACDKAKPNESATVVETFVAKVDMFRGYRYREVTQYDSAFFFLNRSLETFEELKDTTFIYEALYRIVNTYIHKSNYVAATDVAMQTMRFIKKGDIFNHVRSLAELSLCYSKSGDSEQAKNIQYEVLKLSETHTDTLLISGVYDRLSTYFAQLG